MKKIVISLLCLLLITGCDKKVSDNIKFKEEYEKYNDTLYNVNIDEDNYFKYTDKDSIISMIKSGSGVIYIGSSKDNISREIVPVLIDAVDSTDIDDVLYMDSNDIEFLSDYIDDELNIPIVIFVYNGEIVKYNIGSLEDKDKLLDIYLDGIHKVLNDICDEECDD